MKNGVEGLKFRSIGENDKKCGDTISRCLISASEWITLKSPSLDLGPHELARLLKRLFDIDIQKRRSCGSTLKYDHVGDRSPLPDRSDPRSSLLADK